MKLVYVYLEPYDGAEVSVRGLEALLGSSHRPAFEALRDLRKLGFLALSRSARNRPFGAKRQRFDAR